MRSRLEEPGRCGRVLTTFDSNPIVSMYGTFSYIYHKNQPNVGKYMIHGSYGNWTSSTFMWGQYQKLIKIGCHVPFHGYILVHLYTVIDGGLSPWTHSGAHNFPKSRGEHLNQKFNKHHLLGGSSQLVSS